MIDVMAELKDAGQYFGSGDFSTGLKKTAHIWRKIPEPKNATPNAYLVVEYGVAFALKLGDFEEAKKWAALAPLFIEKRQDRGEVEFLVGKVALASGEIEGAKQNFIVADRKSKGRIFQGEDPKYKALIR